LTPETFTLFYVSETRVLDVRDGLFLDRVLKDCHYHFIEGCKGPDRQSISKAISSNRLLGSNKSITVGKELKRKTRVLVLIFLFLLGFTLTVIIAQESGFKSLVEGSSLEHWQVLPGHVGHWRAIDSVIDYDGKSEGSREERNLYTKLWFRDFIFEFEWRFPGPMVEGMHRITLPDGGFAKNPDGSYKREKKLSAGDSGIMLRGWSKLQVNLWCHAMGSGQLYGFQHDMSLSVKKRRACVPAKNTDKPAGEWNFMRITMVGETVTIEQNGELIIDRVDLPGLPYGGPLGLQHHGDWIQFRNLRIKELR